MNAKQQPLGLVPRYIWIEQIADRYANERFADIRHAISRYTDSATEVPIEWINEYNEIARKINDDGVKPEPTQTESEIPPEPQAPEPQTKETPLWKILKEYRREHRLTQGEFAEKCGLSNATISRIESNPQMFFTREVYQQLETVLGVLPYVIKRIGPRH